MKYFSIAFIIFATMAFYPQALVNRNATPEAKALKAMLDSLYGKKLISGQVNQSWLPYINQVTGKSPAIMGFDFNGICPSQGGNNDANSAIDWVKNKHGIAQFQWHWISPDADGDFYTKNFKLGAALQDTTSSSYKNLIRDLDLVAAAIKKMQDAGVPIIWRPLHEAEGGWFWWGMSGGDACKQLWRLMYDRFVNYHKLNNLIWVWNSYGYTKENWYPGDDEVDIIAWDYPDYSNTTNGSWNQYQRLFGGNGKLFAIGEDGKLTDPNVLSTQHWLYFLTWDYMVQEPSQTNGKNPKDWLTKVYNDPRVLTLDDLQPGAKANAGYPQIVYDLDGSGSENVTLDGTQSKALGDSIVSYIWSENDRVLASKAIATVNLPVGIHTLSLTITTLKNDKSTTTVSVTVKKKSLSYGKQVTVSSTEMNTSNNGKCAVDGDMTTHWSSAYSDPQWIIIDLSDTADIKEIDIEWDNGSAKDYQVEISNDRSTWSLLTSLSDQAAGSRTDALNVNAHGRYLRIYGTSRNSTYGYTIDEIDVYSTASNTGLLTDFWMAQNYPNPFNTTTQIRYNLPQSSSVKLAVYNILGAKVDEIRNEFETAGLNTVEYNAAKLSSGVYFLSLTACGKTITKKISLLK